MNLIGSDMILFGSNFKIRKLSFMLVSALTNSGVKNQVPQFLFKATARDLISFHSLGSVVNLFRSDLHSDMIYFVHILKSKSFQPCL